MARRPHPKKLLVEGDEDKRVVPELIEAHGIPWGENSDEWIVEISQCDGFENVVKPGAIETELKVSGREALGIIADANSDAERRWESVRNRCLRSLPDLPKDLPAGGLIHENAEGLKLGVWLMPDNQSRGMMETFLTYLVPDHGDVLLGHANPPATEPEPSEPRPLVFAARSEPSRVVQWHSRWTWGSRLAAVDNRGRSRTSTMPYELVAQASRLQCDVRHFSSHCGRSRTSTMPYELITTRMRVSRLVHGADPTG